ncbi:transcriptional regulator of acetoin/glycerol metabolism [Pseudorhodoferax soli]|uniref:Transcriptional regulator of acetoin/glycerol metabolism n=2 Tax=Pseudorhodoferax soli TaxID=545864 RepID=A0A368XLS2_9BURK|nr:transcriptional regulator of acetoin/glycerol metabolism [Pseudorhodoferax soli]
MGCGADDQIDFQPIGRSLVAELFDSNHQLMEAARPELVSLADALGGAGYAVLLTDPRGNALAVDGALTQRSSLLQRALRVGVDLSEEAIGTSAMSVALHDRRPARVLGAEHFYSEIQTFHCSAVPIFDPQGLIVGALDVSRDIPAKVDCTLWHAARCARRIERRLFLELPAQFLLELDTCNALSDVSDDSGAWIALDESGRCTYASVTARYLLGCAEPGALPDFEAISAESFSSWATKFRRSACSSIRLLNGVQLQVRELRASRLPHHDRRPTAPPVRTQDRPERSLSLGDTRMNALFDKGLRAARAGLPILVAGETGTGKEFMARALHASGPRASRPFIAVNCAGIPLELQASELFGYEEGAFTGSKKSGFIGKIQAAQGGTLFLDEIGDTPLSLQVALLRFLDSGEIFPLGARQARKVDVSVVCATHRSLNELVRNGTFREDFLHRISGYTMRLLPLRERSDFHAVLDTVLETHGLHPSCASAVLREQLKAFPWPGNVRQLSHAVLRAAAFREGEELAFADFELGPLVKGGQAAQSHRDLRDLVARTIDDVIAESDGSVAIAAKKLGVGRATIYRRLKQRKA